MTDKEVEFKDFDAMKAARQMTAEQEVVQIDKTHKTTYYCSFCGKSQHEVKKLIAGPTVFICDECVYLFLDIIKEELQPLPPQINNALVELKLDALKYEFDKMFPLMEDFQRRIAELLTMFTRT